MFLILKRTTALKTPHLENWRTTTCTLACRLLLWRLSLLVSQLPKIFVAEQLVHCTPLHYHHRYHHQHHHYHRHQSYHHYYYYYDCCCCCCYYYYYYYYYYCCCCYYYYHHHHCCCDCAQATGATCGATVSMSAFLACHQCYCAGSSLAWGLNLRAVVCGIFWSSSPGVFSGYSGFLPSFIGLMVQPIN